jgi:hypothetical protein
MFYESRERVLKSSVGHALRVEKKAARCKLLLATKGRSKQGIDPP